MEKAVLVERIDTKLTIIFNRPKIRSPLSTFVLEALNEILDDCVNDASVETIVFTGREDVFASGADLREIAKVNGETAREFAARGQDLMNKIATARPLTVAAVNGFCFGGALDLALACDKRIATPTAVFSHPGANLGIITGWGGTQRLPRLIGATNALEMFLTAKRVDATEACRIGLIDEIAEDALGFSLANFPAKSSS